MKTSKPATPARSRPTNPVVGNAAGETVGTGSDTTQSSDWMAEMTLSPATSGPTGAAGTAADADPAVPAAAPQGVPISTRSARDHHRGEAVESKRGQR